MPVAADFKGADNEQLIASPSRTRGTKNAVLVPHRPPFLECLGKCLESDVYPGKQVILRLSCATCSFKAFNAFILTEHSLFQGL